jgi:hypothetical protein
MYRVTTLSCHRPFVGYLPCALALGQPGLNEKEKLMKIHRLRLVLECVKLATDVIRLVLVLLNMAINYAHEQGRFSGAVEMVYKV